MTFRLLFDAGCEFTNLLLIVLFEVPLFFVGRDKVSNLLLVVHFEITFLFTVGSEFADLFLVFRFEIPQVSFQEHKFCLQLFDIWRRRASGVFSGQCKPFDTSQILVFVVMVVSTDCIDMVSNNGKSQSRSFSCQSRKMMPYIAYNVEDLHTPQNRIIQEVVHRSSCHNHIPVSQHYHPTASTCSWHVSSQSPLLALGVIHFCGFQAGKFILVTTSHNDAILHNHNRSRISLLVHTWDLAPCVCLPIEDFNG
mmetsp:Transcript_26086/g.60585  ORF Transcript_26086/g.60585 Transcript_26086/m.60585 type:complete len:252 (+) Transcript_26086:1333-2088(+)